MSGDSITSGNIAGVGIAIGTGAQVIIYGDVHYYPVVLQEPLRSIFKPLIEDRVRLFGGRDEILTRIGSFIQQGNGGYLVVNAPAGFGKTALMAALVCRTPEAFAYHFFTPLYGVDSLREDFFLRNIVQQMAAWHGHKEELPDNIDELRALYQRFLDTPLDRVRILVLDGLDEITAWKLAPYLSRRLLNGLHFILTVRDVGQDWMAEYQLPADQVKTLSLSGLSRDEIVTVLRATGDRGRLLADNVRAIDALLNVAVYDADPTLGTDPFYIRLLAEDVQSGVLTLINITDVPRGLDAYLDRWWQEMKQAANGEPMRDLLGTLAVTLAPIEQADLELINPSLVDDWSRDYFHDVLNGMRRFVVGNMQHGYSLAHPRLKEYVRNRIRIAPYEQKVLAYCGNWPHHRRPYALRFYLRHLADCDRWMDLIEVARNINFQQAQQEVLGTTLVATDGEVAIGTGAVVVGGGIAIGRFAVAIGDIASESNTPTDDTESV